MDDWQQWWLEERMYIVYMISPENKSNFPKTFVGIFDNCLITGGAMLNQELELSLKNSKQQEMKENRSSIQFSLQTGSEKWYNELVSR